MKNILLTTLVFSLTYAASAKNRKAEVTLDTVLTNENVIYTVTSDEMNMHVKLSTTDEKTMMSMLRLGVSVFFDIKGKKKQNVFVKYPSEPLQGQRKERPQGRPERSSRSEPTSIEEDQAKRKKRIKDILENDYSQNAQYGYFGETEDFHILMNNLNMSAAFTYNEEEGVLEYNLVLPKSKISTDVDIDLSKLTIGVKTIKVKRERENQEGVQGSIGGISLGGQQRGGRSGGGRGQAGGRSGGGRSGGGQGGQGGQRGGPRNSGNQSDTLLNFWFKAS